MKKIWLVFKYEYTRHVMRKRFIIALLSMPLFIGFMMAISIAASLLSINKSPVGYVDLSGAFNNFTPDEPTKGLFQDGVQFIPYQSVEQANADLKSETIQAYYVIAEDYLQTSNARLVYLVAPGSNIEDQFSNQIRQYLFSSQPKEVVNRINEGSHMTIVSADGTRSVGENDWFNLALQFGTGILFIIVLFTSSGYLMQALVEEKENRTMEIVITSVSPEQLMAGKVLGNLSVGLTQLAVWMACVLIAILVGRNSLDWMQNIQISTSTLVTFAVTMIPAFIMVAALMALLGATVSEAREAQQWTGLITLPVVAPYWLATPIIVNPNSTLAVGLSLFPLTAPVTISMRMAVAIIPIWQIALSSILLILCAIGAIWLAAKTFRLGMVRYGKKVSLTEIFEKKGNQHA